MAAPMSLPRFFKVIHDQEKKEETRIPKAFASKYWKGLSNPIFLRLPNGDKWKIFWEKRDDDIWLQKNWKEFAESLKYGYFLVFEYKGESHFLVSIFNCNTLEINYPSKRCAFDTSEEDDDSVHIVEESEISTQPRQKKKINSNGSEPESGPSERTNNNGKRKINVDFDATQQEISGANRGSIVKTKNCTKVQAIEEISRNFDSETENPFCVVILTPSYLQQNLMVLPSDFSRKHLYGLGGIATIIIGKDLTSTWDVTFKFDYGKERARFGTGWKSFCQDNNLQVGDGCVFEMMKRNPVTFKIHIKTSSDQLQGEGHEANRNKPKRRVEENMECFGNSRSCSKKPVLENSGSPNMEPDKFEITVKSYYPNIPREFVKRHSKCVGNFVKLKVGERSWDVKVLKFANHTRICEGWGPFKRACGLKIDDICVFEMFDEEKLEFKVSIISRSHH